jgi:cytochrome c oxidase accessory protein FixG
VQSTARRHLPVLPPELVSSIDPRDGRRRLPVVADVRGRFTTLRRVLFAVLIAIWVAVPLARLGGRPLVFLDVERGQFFLLGGSFGVQDIHLLFFVLTGLGFALVVTTAVVGRAFCGFACPQTVFLEGVFRPLERLTEGPRAARLRRDAGGWTVERVARKAAKHALFLIAATLVAHACMSFFVSWPGLLAMVKAPPAMHPQAFAWAVALTGLTYANFAFFREQICLVVCPYGRLQGVLVDRDTVVVGYDRKRGEPRGKATDPTAGACVDCNRCVVVCPTGIDIRNGLQLDCIGCSACVDACDDVMDRLERPRGLVRFDSQRGLDGEPRRILRPRLAIYGALGVVGLIVAGVFASRREDVSGQVLRASGAPYVVEGDTIRNSFTVVIGNRRDAPMDLVLTGEGEGLHFAFPAERVAVSAMGTARVSVVVTAPRGHQPAPFTVLLTEASTGRAHRASGRFVAPIVPAQGGSS